MIKSILNDSQDFTSLNWRSQYPKIALIRLKVYPIFRLLQDTGIYNLPFYLRNYEFSGETEFICGCRKSKVREKLAQVKLISFLRCQSESRNKEFCWVRNMMKQGKIVLIC